MSESSYKKTIGGSLKLKGMSKKSKKKSKKKRKQPEDVSLISFSL